MNLDLYMKNSGTEMISLDCDEVSSRGRVLDEAEIVQGKEDGLTNDSQSVNGWRLHILTVG